MNKRIILLALIAFACLASGVRAQQPTKNWVYCVGGTSFADCTVVTPSSSYTFLSTAAVQAASIKASAGIVWDITCFNIGADASYIRLYNQSTSPGSGDGANILWQGVIPPLSSTVAGGFVITFANGHNFSTGIGIRVTEGIASTDTTALNNAQVTCSVGYQ